MVLRVVIVVGETHVEGHAKKYLVKRLFVHFQLFCHVEQLGVVMGSQQVVIHARHSAERLHVQLLAAIKSIETFGHEMALALNFHKGAVDHVDAAGFCRQAVGVFDETKRPFLAGVYFEKPGFISCGKRKSG